jgi:hypothetical protein
MGAMQQIAHVVTRMRAAFKNRVGQPAPLLSIDAVRWDEDLYVYHHLGLGDMIHCNGLVRHLAKRLEPHRRLYVFCKERSMDMTRWMYRDEPRIQLLTVDESDREYPQVKGWLRKCQSSNFLLVGHRALRPLLIQHPKAFFDQLFYLQVGVPYTVRFDECYWERDTAEELRVFEQLAPKGPYAFVHDDPSRGYKIDTDDIDLPIVRNDPSVSLFHLGLLLERAAEVHCMESSIRCMIESLDVRSCRLFYHNFRYPDRPLGTATCHRWVSVEYPQSVLKESPR